MGNVVDMQYAAMDVFVVEGYSLGSMDKSFW